LLGQYAYLADGSEGLHVIDISDPATPEIVGSLPLPGSARDVRVHGSSAYVAAEAAGLHVVSIDLPESPKLARSIPIPGNTTSLHAEGEDLAALACARDGGLIALSLKAGNRLHLPVILRS
ncbi:MAG: hypothetical protein JSW37_12850, partial [Anaerolineales bacterium]